MKRLSFTILVTFWLTICMTPYMATTQSQTLTPPSTQLPSATHTAYLPLVIKRTSQSNPPRPTATPRNTPTPRPSPTPGPTPTSRPPGQEIPWPMVAANPERTSWTQEEVTGFLDVEWYRPIEAYIPQNVQIIASNGLIFVSTARGLYALNADDGELAWRYDTELPLGNSPTVSNSVVYVGGYDRKLHALNALTGAHLWAYQGAGAGYDTNPLVIDAKVFAGNRDGYMYAIGAHGAASQGQLIWRFKAGGPIHHSAAYKNGVLYFAADDNYAYALNASNGSLVWKSQKLPGDGYHSFWPVVYQNFVVFTAAPSYRMGLEPGTLSVPAPAGTTFGTIREMEVADLFPNEPDGAVLGPVVPSETWGKGYPVIDASRVTQYLENNPNPDPHKHKPWRRTVVVLNISNGSEYTFDSDGDGRSETIPIAFWGTNSGNRYPPIVGSDNILYVNNLYIKSGDSQGRVMGWKVGTPYLSVLLGQGAIAEPQAISGGGNYIYRSLCCDRLADFFGIDASLGNKILWSYDLSDHAPGYDETWTILPGWPRLRGWYQGTTESVNGIYHNAGDQNPIVPYMGRLYTHRSNAVIAYGSLSGPNRLPLIQINSAQSSSSSLSEDELRARLESEVQKIVDAGHLRPGYYGIGQFSNYREYTDYFENPGDTLYTLAKAYPYLSTTLQGQVRTYLRSEFDAYFDAEMYATIGWANGAAREWMPLPAEVSASLPDDLPQASAGPSFSWFYPPHNFYAMWKYAQIFPQDASRVYDLAKGKLQVPVPQPPVPEWFYERPNEYNAYIAGYIGFMNLQTLAGRATADSQLRTQVNNELNRLLQLRVSTFDKDTPFGEDRFVKKHLDIARNFMMLVPELGDYLYQHAQPRMREAVSEYEYIAPYWFVSRFESAIGEGALSNLYNYNAMFLAKAYILKQPRTELTKYLDAPAFDKGDLFYIQNLVAALEAP